MTLAETKPRIGDVPETQTRQTRAVYMAEYIQNLRVAADHLIGRGLDLSSRLTALRGIYYGAPHSLDFEKRHSRLRNLGFNLYLCSLPPRDPSPIIGTELFQFLKHTSEVVHDGCLVDVGHVFVGLEARRRLLARNLRILAQGGTGLELATWVGDLGGASGLLSVGRMDKPGVRAKDLLFSPDTYDLSANLEGDVAGYLVARIQNTGLRPSRPNSAVFSTVPDALQAYLGGPLSDWSKRHLLFTQMIGGIVVDKRIVNKNALTDAVVEKTRAFASFYLIHRLKHLGRLSG